jgi:hypothetical protein
MWYKKWLMKKLSVEPWKYGKTNNLEIILFEE